MSDAGLSRCLILPRGLACGQAVPAEQPLTVGDVVMFDYITVLIVSTHVAVEMLVTNNLVHFFPPTLRA